MKGLQGLLDFLRLLRSKNIGYRLDHERDDAVMVTLNLVGVIVEVDFFIDRVEFSTFTGDERVSNDERALMQLIEEYGH